MSEHAHDGGHEHESHGGTGTYIAVFLALCVLTSASFFTTSSYWPYSDHVAWVFMMAVSCTKALLVMLFFMHLLWEANWKWVLTLPAMFMSVFLVLMLVPDMGWRMHHASEERLLHMAVPVAADQADSPHDGASHGHAGDHQHSSPAH